MVTTEAWGSIAGRLGTAQHGRHVSVTGHGVRHDEVRAAAGPTSVTPSRTIAGMSPRTLVRRTVHASEARPSPDGKLLCYELRTAPRPASFRHDIWLSRIDGSEARPLTAAGGSASGPRWSTAGDQLAWIRLTSRGARIEICTVNGGHTRAATDTFSEVAEIAWAPAGDRVAFVGRLDRERPGPIAHRVQGLAYKQDGRGVVTSRRGLHIVDIDTGQITTVEAGDADLSSPRWSPDGRFLAARIKDPRGYRSRLRVLDLSDEAAFEIGDESSGFPQFAWSPDSRRLLIVGGTEYRHHPDLYLYDLETRQLGLLTQTPPILVVDDPVWVATDRAILNGRTRGRSGLYEVDVVSGSIRPVAASGGRLWGLAADARGEHLAQVRESLEGPPEVVVFDPEGRGWQTVTHANTPVLAGSRIGSLEAHTVASDEYEIDYWLLRPDAASPKNPHPVVVIVHGGPHDDAGDEWDRGLAQCLSSHGFHVVWANARGSTSYGPGFAAAVSGDYGGGEFRDLLAVVGDIVARPDVDPGRIGILGWSHGGYMAAWATGNSRLFRSAVCISPIVDLLSEWGMSDEGHGWAEIALLGSPRDKPDWYRERSPATHAWRSRTPTLILHGELDERCPIGQSELLYSILKSNGTEAEFVRYPRAAHDVMDSPAATQDVMERILEWFSRTLADGG